MLDPENHRAKNSWQAGPLFDMGTYPLNAARKLFQDEPIEVFAVGIHHPEVYFVVGAAQSHLFERTRGGVW